MKRVLILILLVLFATSAWGVGVRRPGGGGDTSSTDGIGTDADMNYLTTATYPGNPTWNGLRKVYVSPDAGGAIEAAGTDYVCDAASTEGPIACTFGDVAATCSGDCDRDNIWATKRLPLASLSGAYNLLEKNGCGVVVELDSGDYFDNLAIGDSSTGVQFGFGEEGVTTTLNCPGSDNSRVAVVVEAYPPGSRVHINYAWQSGSGTTQTPATDGEPAFGTGDEAGKLFLNDAPDIVLVNTGSSATIITDASITMVADELIGGRLLVTAQGGACDVPLGSIENITDNDATTVTTTAFVGAAVYTGCTYVAVTASAETGATINDLEHFQFNGKDEGQAVMINTTLHNVFEASAISGPEKDATTSVGLWGVEIDGDLENGLNSAPIIHMNSPGSSWLFQTDVRNISTMIPLNTSGSIFVTGSEFQSLDTNDVNVVFNAGGFYTAIFDSTFNANYPTQTGNSTISGILGTCNLLVAGDCEMLVARSVVSGSDTADEAGIFHTCNDTDITSCLFKALYTSVVRNQTGIRILYHTTPTVDATVFMRANIFDEFSDEIFQVAGSLEKSDWDIQDMAYDDGEQTSEWRTPAGTVSTLALFRDAFEGAGDITLGGLDNTSANADIYIFGSSTDIDVADTDAAVGTDADTDRVVMGGCHQDVEACFQVTTYSIDETLNSSLALPTWALPSGEAVTRWQLNSGEVTRDRGGAH